MTDRPTLSGKNLPKVVCPLPNERTVQGEDSKYHRFLALRGSAVVIAQGMIGKVLGHRFDPVLWRVAKALRLDLSPNLITLLGLGVSALASLLIAKGLWAWGGLIFLLGGFFDMLDGAVARTKGRTTPFGAFLDSVVDRFSDFLAFIALASSFSLQEDHGRLLLTLFALMGSILVPFCRARAETVIASCKVGILERPERVILFALGLITGLIDLALWSILILSFVTVFQRIHYTWRALKGQGP